MKKSHYVPDDYPMAHPRDSGRCALFTFAQSAELSCPDEAGAEHRGVNVRFGRRGSTGRLPSAQKVKVDAD